MDLQAIRQGIATTLGTIEGLRVYTVPNPQIVPPCVVVQTQSPFIDYYTANAKGLATLSFELMVVVGRQDDRLAQERLDTYLSAGAGHTKSIIDALEADRTLDGTAQSSTLGSTGDYFADNNLAAVVIPLTVYASRKLV